MKSVILSNDTKLPAIGFGTYNMHGNEAIASVTKAIELGYRLIDGAAYYGNEKEVGEAIDEAIQNHIVKREDLLITSKLWSTHMGYKNAIQSFNQTLNDLNVNYLDLYLIHWPANAVSHPHDWNQINLDTWRALEDLYRVGKVKAIGVANFLPHHFRPLMNEPIKPMVNQIECHIGYMPEDVINYCQSHDIQIEAWSPLGRGRIFKDETLNRLSEKYQVTTAQLALRFLNQQNIVVLPKSVDEKRMIENKDIFNFTIDDEDMNDLKNIHDYWSHLDPDQKA